MLKNRLGLAFRILRKQKPTSVITVALLTVGWQAVRAARADPADTLRTE